MIKIFDSKLIQGELPPSFAYDYPINPDRIDKIKHIIEVEKIRAISVFEKTYTVNEKSR